MYYIAMINDEGKWQALDNLPSYSAAEDIFDAYCDMYPNAYIDIVSAADYNSQFN